MSNILPNSDAEFIGSLIPQKKPFIMVQEISEFTENTVQSKLIISEDNLFVSEGLFQASGIIEHQAQTVALHTGYQYHLLGKEAPTGYIGAIKSVKIENLPKLNDVLVSEAKILNEMMGVTLVEITTTVNNEIIAQSQLKTVVK